MGASRARSSVGASQLSDPILNAGRTSTMPSGGSSSTPQSGTDLPEAWDPGWNGAQEDVEMEGDEL